MNILIQATLLVFPPVIVGCVTLPWTHKLAKGNFYLQSVYLAGLRLIWTIFVLVFPEEIIYFVKNLF
jgi:hypothetical protein